MWHYCTHLFSRRAWLAPAAATLCTGLFLATPLVHLVTGNLFIENFQAAMLVGAIVS
jgi:hypothetical protein